MRLPVSTMTGSKKNISLLLNSGQHFADRDCKAIGKMKKNLTSPYFEPRERRRTLIRRVFNPWWIYLLARKTCPLSYNYGINRGVPIDRYYIEKFLEEHRSTITGHCLEIGDDKYIRTFGTPAKIDILDYNLKNKKANIYADLRNMPQIPENIYDCIILTQVLQFIDDYESAIKECYRILKPHGAVLATMPFNSRTDVGVGIAGDYWRFTKASAEYVFKKYFDSVSVKSMGNVLSGLGFWVGMALEEFPVRKLDMVSDEFPLLITVKAVK